jgi:hypothetical protein
VERTSNSSFWLFIVVVVGAYSIIKSAARGYFYIVDRVTDVVTDTFTKPQPYPLELGHFEQDITPGN